MLTYPDLRNLLLSKSNSTSQKSIADECGVSQATVSYWLSGKRRPRKSHLIRLSKLLNISPYELAKASGYNTKEVDQLLSSDITSSSDLDFAKFNLGNISKIRIAGEHQLALTMANQLQNWIDSKLSHSGLSKTNNELLKLKAWCLVELINIHNQIMLPNQFIAFAKSVIQEIQEIANKISDAELFWVADFLEADAWYLMNRYEESIIKTAASLDYIESVDHRLRALRTLALDYAYLGEQFRFRTIANEIEELINSGNFKTPSIAIIACEGVTRSKAILGILDSTTELDKAWELYEEYIPTRSPLLEVGIKRSLLESLCKIEPSNISEIQKLGDEIISVANQFSYPRYTSKVKDIFSKILNN